jgi:hypothetical protein
LGTSKIAIWAPVILRFGHQGFCDLGTKDFAIWAPVIFRFGTKDFITWRMIFLFQNETQQKFFDKWIYDINLSKKQETFNYLIFSQNI